MACIREAFATLHYTTQGYTTLHYTRIHYTTPGYTTLHYSGSDSVIHLHVHTDPNKRLQITSRLWACKVV